MVIEDAPKSNSAESDQVPERESRERKVTRILLAEDDQNLRESLQDTLRYEDYAVEAVENGQLLVDKLANGEYDLVIMDNDMPILTGVQALKEIRNQGKSLPVIVFSTRSGELQKTITELGGTCLSKEAPQDFLPTIKMVLEGVK